MVDWPCRGSGFEDTVFEGSLPHRPLHAASINWTSLAQIIPWWIWHWRRGTAGQVYFGGHQSGSVSLAYGYCGQTIKLTPTLFVRFPARSLEMMDEFFILLMNLPPSYPQFGRASKTLDIFLPTSILMRTEWLLWIIAITCGHSHTEAISAWPVAAQWSGFSFQNDGTLKTSYFKLVSPLKPTSPSGGWIWLWRDFVK